MKTIIDKKSGLLICIDNNDERYNKILDDGFSQYNVVKWCEQYLTKDSTFIDIGSDLGDFTLILSKSCEKVHSYEFSKTKYEHLSMSGLLNNLFNVKYYNYEIPKLKDDEVKNLKFIHIGIDDTISILQTLKSILQRDHPHILFKNNDNNTSKFLFDINYDISSVSNSGGLFIAGPSKNNNSKENNKEENKEENKENTDIITDECSNLFSLAIKLRKENKLSAAFVTLVEAESFLNDESDKLSDLINFEKCIICKNIGKINEGLNACENLLYSNKADWNIKNHVLGLIEMYIERLPVIKTINISGSIPDGYVSSSSSIMRSENGYKIILRTVNYYIGEKGSYHVIGGDSKVNTRNFLLNVGKDFNILDQTELINKSGILIFGDSPVLGIEDIRGVENENWFFGCCRDTNVGYHCQMCIGEYDNSGTINSLIPMSNGTTTEKNWLPFILDGVKSYIYGWHPFKIIKLTQDGPIEFVNKFFPNINLSTIRGSTPPIQYNNGYLAVIHNVHYNDPRKYYHRFVWLNNDFSEIKISHPFYIVQPGIEYTLSICHSDMGLLMGYSFRDTCSRCLVIDYLVVDKYLNTGLNIHD